MVLILWLIFATKRVFKSRDYVLLKKMLRLAKHGLAPYFHRLQFTRMVAQFSIKIVLTCW